MNDQQALELISRICGDDFCEELDMRVRSPHLSERAQRKMRGDLAAANEKLGKVYRIAHALVRSRDCYHVHDDWRKDAEKMVDVMEAERGQPPTCLQGWLAAHPVENKP